MATRNDHHVTVVVGIPIEDDVGRGAEMNDKRIDHVLVHRLPGSG
jgi:hypothetical protein